MFQIVEVHPTALLFERPKLVFEAQNHFHKFVGKGQRFVQLRPHCVDIVGAQQLLVAFEQILQFFDNFFVVFAHFFPNDGIVCGNVDFAVFGN